MRQPKYGGYGSGIGTYFLFFFLIAIVMITIRLLS